MKRATLFAVLFALLLSQAGAMGPLVIQVVTEPSGVSYRFGGTDPGMNREALAAWFADSKPWGPEPALLSAACRFQCDRPVGSSLHVSSAAGDPLLSRKLQAADTAASTPAGTKLRAVLPRLTTRHAKLYVDAATTFYTVSDLVTLLKETGGVEQFEIYVTAEPKGEPRALVTYALQLGKAQIAPTERKLLPPPGASPEAVLRNIKPGTPPPPKLSQPPAK